METEWLILKPGEDPESHFKHLEGMDVYRPLTEKELEEKKNKEKEQEGE